MIEGLNDSVYEILNLVETITNKSFDFVEKSDLDVYAAVRIARENMPKHILYYKTSHSDLLNHLIPHECGHIIRLFKAPPEKRVMAAVDNETKEIAFTEMQNDIVRLNDELGFDKTAAIINMQYTGVVRQITNYPPDIMIERWIYREYPALRTFQLKSFQKQFDDAVEGTKPEVKALTPGKIYAASNLMNYAFFRILGKMVGENFVRLYGSSIISLDEGKALAGIVEKVDADNFETDIKLVNEWVLFLGMASWFKWVPFEAVPSDY